VGRQGVTVSPVDPLIVLSVAVMVTIPAATGVARPSLPEALLTVAMFISLEVHVTSVVMFCVVASE